MTQEHSIISVSRLSKSYRLYASQRQRLLEAVIPFGRKRHKEFKALDDISFAVKSGETFGIIGQNGSGKSTLLKIITGVLTQTTGEASVSGRVAALLELGAGFHPEFTGLENIYLNGSIMGLSRDEVSSKLAEITAFADIGDHLHQPIKTYSSGMFVRLAFAIAINVDPDILIVDEALSVGDLFFQVKCYKKFEEFKKRGKTILFVTHDLGTIVKYCDRAMVLDRGKKLGEGSPREMVDLYKKASAKITARYTEALNPSSKSSQQSAWKESFTPNPSLEPYGTGEAVITDYGIFDHLDRPAATLQKSENFAIRFKVEFKSPVAAPIFAVTIRDRKGTELCGTNTWLEKHEIKPCSAGDHVTITFSQAMNLQGGQYLLSLGCTGFDDKGDFVVYNRLYDVLQFDVLAEKNTVGFFDMNSHVAVNHESGPGS
jgi:ABC-type polysaccharide/polyol phosphate transport system ATPase subunit